MRTDSTHILAAIRTLSRLECIGETLRQALNVLATAAPDWLRSWAPAEWYDRYSRRFEDYRLPKSRADRYALGERVLCIFDFVGEVIKEQPTLRMAILVSRQGGRPSAR